MRQFIPACLATLTNLIQRKLHHAPRPHHLTTFSRLGRFEPLEDRRLLSTWNVETLLDNGAVDKRIDMVFVGDGFVNSEIADEEDKIEYYIDEVDGVVDVFFSVAPFDEYMSYFNVHRVDVISTEAGVDRPFISEPIEVETALDGYVKENNRLAVDDNEADVAAEDAPDWDLMQVILNSKSGPGYNSGTPNAGIGGGRARTSIASNGFTHLHEVGHSLGRLGDEYFSENGDTFMGAEPNYPNLTKISSEQDMENLEKKWFRWLADPQPSEIGVFEGGAPGSVKYEHGVYRPSDHSIMNDGTAFDAVGKEALIIEMYKQPDISTIVDATAPGVYYNDHEFFVTSMEPATHDLDIQWFVDGSPVSGATGDTFNPDGLNLPMGEYTVSVEVVDNTDMVRDPDAREMFLTDSMEWTFQRIIQVTTEVDEDGTNPSAVSLREAIDIAGNETTHPGPDKIIFAPDVLEILLSEGELVIDNDVEIVGPGVDTLTIGVDAMSTNRVFSVESGVEATIAGLSITGGDAAAGLGGGILSEGDLWLKDVDISGNQASDGAGIAQLGGSLKVERSTISGNTASSLAGGIYTQDVDLLDVSASTIAGNSAAYGGGISIYNTDLELRNTTISGNTASVGYGGGIFFYSNPSTTALLANVTIAFNEVGAAGGGGMYISESSGTSNPSVDVVLHNTIVTENLRVEGMTQYDDDITGEVNEDSSYNLIGSGGSGGLQDDVNGNLVGVTNAGLATLGFYGGPTMTHALLAGSPAIDRGSDNEADNAGLSTDQRGYGRFFDHPSSSGPGGIVDIGAVEFSVARVVNVIISSTEVNPYGNNPPYEFDEVVGTEEQLQTVPVGGANQVSVQFTEHVDIEEEDLQLIALNRVIPAFTVLDFVPPESWNEFTATWTLEFPNIQGSTIKPILPGQYLLRLDDSIISDQGFALDGEWTNPSFFDYVEFTTNGPSQTTSTFPSGNNVAGGDFEFVFSILPGDVDRDNTVDIDDLIAVKNHTTLVGDFEFGDTNGNGIVDIFDLIEVKNTFGFDFQQLTILGDYDNDFDLDGDDETDFLSYYNSSNSAADLDGDGNVDSDDYDAFYELYGLGIDLDVVT